MRKKIDRFLVHELLSEGSGGTVYLADEQLPCGVTRPVALKLLPVISDADAMGEQRFQAEVRLCVALAGHPGVVTVYGMGFTDRLPWIAMEYVPSVLATLIGEQPSGSEQVLKMVQQVASGLSALHALTPPVLHNDLTPSNILVDKFGNHKISDFGLATPASVERTRVLATVKYTAPESLSRELGGLCPATDLYALGHIAYEMALGGKLYRQQFPAVYDARGAAKEATPAKWMAWHCSMGTHATAVHEILPEFPVSLGNVIAKLMRKPVAERYATAQAMLADLDNASAPSPMPVIPASPAPVPVSLQFTPEPGELREIPSPPPPPMPRAAATASRGERYYVRLGGRVSGPFDLPTLQQQMRRGLLSRLHQLSTDRATWQSAATIEGLFLPSTEE